MRFNALGPLSLSQDGKAVSLGGRKQRTLLAVLLLRRNQNVPRDALVEALWGEHPPPSWGQTLDSYLYRLRKIVGRDRLMRETGGYMLRLELGEVDVDEFERLVASAGAAAESGDHAAALDELTVALALWRGPAWGDLLDHEDAEADARRLEELRLTALESRFEEELALGHGAELAPELEQLVEEHPLRERLIASEMLSLYRAGRQTDALDAFQTARRRLVDELGLEPGPELCDLQRRILEHEPTLGASRRLPPFSLTRRRRSRAAAGLVVLAVLAVLGGGVVVLSPGAAGRRFGLAEGFSRVVAVDAATGRLVSSTPLPEAPGSVADGGGSLWVATPGAQQVSALDPGSGAIVDPHIPVSGSPGSVVSGGGAIWVASAVGSTVTRIDPATDSVTQTISLAGANLDAITYGAGRVWVADAADRELFEINPVTGRREQMISLDLEPSAVTIEGGALWVAGYDDATVEKLDLASGRLIGRVHVGGGPVALTFDAGSLWVANSLDSTVSQIEPATLIVTATLPVGSGPTALAAGSGAVWVANQYSGTVSRIDPMHDAVVATVGVGGAPTSLAITGRRVWVGVGASRGRHRGGTLVIATTATTLPTSNIDAVDPATYFAAFNPQFTGLAYDALVNFQQTPGAAGLRLVPDLAVSIPTPADGGRTYAFRIRPGIRYSDGQRLRAGDFRRGVERLFRLGSEGSYLYADLVGARACVRRPRNCDLAQAIVANDTAGIVTFHFSSPDPEFLFQLTESGFSAPIPPRTPDHEIGERTVPGTGPYRIVSVTPGETRFVRNPYFQEWSHAAQPAGNPNAIVWRTFPSTRAAVAAIQHGQADWLWGEVPLAQYRRLKLQDPADLHSNPQFSVEFLPLNTHVPPFSNLLARRAFNYAINRAKIAQLYGGPSFATPICQPIAPGLPGFRRYCPYTLRPRADGVWSAPNLGRARQLVARSGTAGERVDVVGSPDEGFIPPTAPAYVAGVLRELGYRVHLRLLPIASVSQNMWDSFQMTVDGDWTANWPDPSSYIPSFLSCGGANSAGYYCHPALDREMRHAELLEPTDPPRARAVWETLDRQLTNNAAWVPTVTIRDIELTSGRLHNYEYNPVWGFLADQSWLQ
jgi:peptide/nickel transport system substrate-binding protein